MDTSGLRERRKQKSGSRGKFICWWNLGFSCFSHTEQAARSVNQLRVWDAVVCSMFSLVGCLPSIRRRFPVLVLHSAGTVRPSDSPATCMLQMDGKRSIGWHADERLDAIYFRPTTDGGGDSVPGG